MNRFVPREKMGKKARRALDAKQRRTWPFPPVTKMVESQKKYRRNKEKHDLRLTESCFFISSYTDLIPGIISS